MRIGGLFSGYGGLEMAAQAVLGGSVAWHSEYEPPTKKNPNPSQAAAKILAHHWPAVPNLGDITKVDWTAVEPVDVITGGSPCQDVSAAGKRAGMKAGTRSGLWASMVDAIDALRPRLVVWENVRGVTSAEADSGLEPCAGCVGDRDDGAVLRALGRVLGDLSDIGYDSRWCGLRAADVGAPHGRFRIFVTAHPRGEYGEQRRQSAPGQAQGGRSLGELAGRSRASAVCGHGARRPHNLFHPIVGRCPGPTTDASRDGWDEGRTQPARIIGGPDAALSGATPTDAYRDGLQSVGRLESVRRDPDRRSSANITWGVYEPAIRRWETILGRPAPRPTEPGTRGGQRLSPRFVEWMQGLPTGHVTDPAIGISRNDQLKALGNGVVPQQAAAALRFLLATKTGERAA